jgi:hypothetical protein
VYSRLKHQSAWIIELTRLFEPCDEQGNVRTARQVKREVKQFLDRLEQEATQCPDMAKVIHNIVKAVRNRWWGLFTCYRVSYVPSSNNDLETFFKDMKHHQRRITGRKTVQELPQVRPEDFNQARQAMQKVQTRLKKLYRFRHHPVDFFRDLETQWQEAVL